jgi:hypothetical protein
MDWLEIGALRGPEVHETVNRSIAAKTTLLVSVIECPPRQLCCINE